MTDPARSRLANARAAVVEEALPQVAEHGWTEAVLDGAIARAGIDAPLAVRAFPDGARSLVEAFHEHCDRRMVEALTAQNLEALRTGQRIFAAVRARIEAMQPLRAQLRRALAFQSMPQNAASGARSLGRTVDLIWRETGDRSHDFSFYTKRATLAAVYSATVLYWLQDTSEGCAETWEFLRRRLQNVVQFGKARQAAQATATGLASGVAAGVVTTIRRAGSLTRWLGSRGIPPAWPRSSDR
ncbi:MAG: hypothetical protein RL477_1137 [Pseudomonadota bacterium]